MKIINLEDLKIEPVKGEHITISTDIGYIDLDNNFVFYKYINFIYVTIYIKQRKNFGYNIYF